MAGLGTADFSDAMKTLYIGPLNDQTFRAHVLLNRLEKNSKDVSGDFAYLPVVSDRNPAVGSRKDVASSTGAGPRFPAAGRQTYNKFTFTMGQHYGRGAVSGTAKRKSRNNAGAFAKAIDEEMAGLMRSLPDDLNRQICGDGSGRAATLSEDQATSTVIAVWSTHPMSARVGDRVHFADRTADATDITPAAGTTIASIAFNTDAAGAASITKHQITLAAASGTSLTTDDDAMYFGAEASLDAEMVSRGQDIKGILALIDDGAIGADYLEGDGTAGQVIESGELMVGPGHSASSEQNKIGGVDRTATAGAFMRSAVKQNPASAGTKRPITETIIQEAWLTAVAQNGAVPDQVEGYCGPGTWGTLGMTQVGSRIYNDYKDSVEMGFAFIAVNGSKVFYDRDLMEGHIFFIMMPHIFLLTQSDYEFIDDDGNVLRNITNRDAWEFAIGRDVALGYNNGRVHTKLTDLTTIMDVNGQLH